MAEISAVIARYRETLAKSGVLTVRPGVEAKNGWVTKRPAIVVTVAEKKPAAVLPASDLLPEELGGFPVDVRQASPLKLMQAEAPQAFMKTALQVSPALRPAEFPEEVRVADASPLPTVPQAVAQAPKKPQIPYTAPPDAPLSAVRRKITVTCSSSPDSGWDTLHAFFQGTDSSLTVGLYDFTSRHVLDALITALTANAKARTLQLVLDHPPLNDTADQTDDATVNALKAALGDRFRFAWALEDRDPFAARWIYPSAYHIKVAVRDHASFWLSSGNWNNSNQPAGDPLATAHKKDRDWHVVISDAGLAQVFEPYLDNDFAVAAEHQQAGQPAQPPDLPAPVVPPPPGVGQAFPAKEFSDTMTIRPVLTPDPGGYVQPILDLINSATKTLYLQYAYVHPPRAGDVGLAPLIAAVKAKQDTDVDVRIILSSFETQALLEQLQQEGIDLADVRIQENVHNKGIVVDAKAVLVSSQNWSTSGVEQNRDAGVVIEHEGVAQFFQAVFLDDWEHRAQQKAADG